MDAVLARRETEEGTESDDLLLQQAETEKRQTDGRNAEEPKGRREQAHGPSVSPERRSEEHTSELQSPCNLVCRLLLEKKKKNIQIECNCRSEKHILELKTRSNIVGRIVYNNNKEQRHVRRTITSLTCNQTLTTDISAE